MAQKLQTLTALPETELQFTEPTWPLTTVCDSSSRGSSALFSLHKALQAHSEQTCMQTLIHTFKKISKINLILRSNLSKYNQI